MKFIFAFLSIYSDKIKRAQDAFNKHVECAHRVKTLDYSMLFARDESNLYSDTNVITN